MAESFTPGHPRHRDAINILTELVAKQRETEMQTASYWNCVE